MGATHRHMGILEMSLDNDIARIKQTQARELFDKYDADQNGQLDNKEMQQLIVDYLTHALGDEELGLLDDPMQEFGEGSRMYCLYSLKLISEDGELTFDKFYEWLQSPDNFLKFPAQKFQVMMWAFDIFEEFDLDGDGEITREEWDLASKNLRNQLESDTNAARGVVVEFNFDEYDIIEKDGAISTKELVTKLLTQWERIYEAVFKDADDFFSDDSPMHNSWEGFGSPTSSR